ncbi:FMR1-interacting protein NUFIP2 [Neoarius graeffei]|uniref:FMR1-interacting protein NUFIP2 n=1 Tax=Neoarius graeffei TaxID=443677 RepID=UPI00298D4CB8|nr:FMR1-interacting protein NUFIP2 [Neoarius graeffei]
MHIKPGTWESNNAVCESDTLCDPAVLVSPPQAEPHIRNRRLSPGSGSCGGGGGGCTARVDTLSPHQTSNSPDHEGSSHGTAHTQSLTREHRAQNRGRGPRREGATQKLHKSSQAQKERWMGETLSSLRPPPAFPVKDSPAKLQPAVSYASKVKAGGHSVGVAEEPPGIGALLQNQWGLSFITDSPAMENSASVAEEVTEPSPRVTVHHVAGEMVSENSVALPSQGSKEPEDSAQLLLTCRHLVEAVQYHTQEWSAVFMKQKEDPVKVVWYTDSS